MWQGRPIYSHDDDIVIHRLKSSFEVAEPIGVVSDCAGEEQTWKNALQFLVVRTLIFLHLQKEIKGVLTTESGTELCNVRNGLPQTVVN